MNWYKFSQQQTTANVMAYKIAQLLIDTYYDVSQGNLNKIFEIVSFLEDENTLNNALNKGIGLALQTLKLENLTPEQQELIGIFYSSFQQKKQENTQLNPKYIQNFPQKNNPPIKENIQKTKNIQPVQKQEDNQSEHKSELV